MNKIFHQELSGVLRSAGHAGVRRGGGLTRAGHRALRDLYVRAFRRAVRRSRVVRRAGAAL